MKPGDTMLIIEGPHKGEHCVVLEIQGTSVQIRPAARWGDAFKSWIGINCLAADALVTGAELGRRDGRE